MSISTVTALEPDEILDDLLGLDPALRRERYWGERSLFYNPGRVAPLGIILASIKDHDGENDRSAALSREGVFRLAFCLAPETYAELFGPVPARPPKGGVVDLPDYDPTRLRRLMPHPVYAWMRWVQILSPTREQYRSLRPHVESSLEIVREKWRRRKAA
jgi:Family of unknown function (DUF6194)